MRRDFVLGVALGFAVALALGAVTTFTSVQGRGTYTAGYVVLPRCAEDITSLEMGSLCADLTDGSPSFGRIVFRDGTGVKVMTGSAIQ